MCADSSPFIMIFMHAYVCGPEKSKQRHEVKLGCEGCGICRS